MERIHERFLDGGRMATVQRPQLISGISPATRPATYVRFGIRPELAQATHSILHQMAALAVEDGGNVNAAFSTLVQQLQRMGRPRKRSVPFIHFLGLAAYHGISFASLGELRDAVDAMHQMTAPGIQTVDKRLQRRRYWNAYGDLIALLGEGVATSPVKRELQAGLSAQVIINAMQILVEQRAAISGSRLLWLSLLCEREDLEASQLGQLVAAHPRRTDDIIELLRRQVLSKQILAELLETPELMPTLSLEALDELCTVWSPSDGSLLQIARAFSGALIETNAQAETNEAIRAFEEEEGDELGDEDESEPEIQVEEKSLPPAFDHTRLDITEPAGRRTGNALEALQILLVHGVIQPDRDRSSMINGSEVPREELEELCEPHLRRAGISDHAFNQAFNFLTTTFVLATSTTGGRKRGGKQHRSRRVRFMAQANYHRRGQEIARRVLDLNREIRG